MNNLSVTEAKKFRDMGHQQTDLIRKDTYYAIARLFDSLSYNRDMLTSAEVSIQDSIDIQSGILKNMHNLITRETYK